MIINLLVSTGLWSSRASQVALVVKNPPANAGDARDASSIPRWVRSPREGDGHPLQYSCLENPTDRGTWRATVHGVTKSQTQLKWLSMHAPWFPFNHSPPDRLQASALLSTRKSWKFLSLAHRACLDIRWGTMHREGPAINVVNRLCREKSGCIGQLWGQRGFCVTSLLER